MNYAIVKSIIGRVLHFEAAFMMLPCVTAVIYKEESGWLVLLYSPCMCAAWFLTYQKSPKKLCLLCERGICICGFKLDCPEYYGQHPLSCGWCYHQSH